MIEPFRKAFAERGIGKRGVSMIFVIAGIAVVVIAALVVFFTSEDVQVGRRISSTQVESVREYVGGCINEQLIEKLNERRMYGGRSSLDFRPSNNRNHPFYNYNVLNKPTDNLLDINIIGREIASDIEDYIKNDGCSLDIFKDNFEIEERKDFVHAEVDISDDFVVLGVNYPVIVKKGGSEIKFEAYDITLEDNFGGVYGLVRGILNGFAGGSTDDISDYCFNYRDLFCFSDPRNDFTLIKIVNIKDLPSPGNVVDPGLEFSFVVSR